MLVISKYILYMLYNVTSLDVGYIEVYITSLDVGYIKVYITSPDVEVRRETSSTCYDPAQPASLSAGSQFLATFLG